MGPPKGVVRRRRIFLGATNEGCRLGDRGRAVRSRRIPRGGARTALRPRRIDCGARRIPFGGRLIEWLGRLIEWLGRLIEWLGRLIEWLGRLIEWLGRLIEWLGRRMGLGRRRLGPVGRRIARRATNPARPARRLGLAGALRRPRASGRFVVREPEGEAAPDVEVALRRGVARVLSPRLGEMATFRPRRVVRALQAREHELVPPAVDPRSARVRRGLLADLVEPSEQRRYHGRPP